MPDLPTGTVTFLFTDIEGSTKLWGQFPEAMKAALGRHDALLRRAIGAHGGYVFKTVGDAFCAAFDTAPEALAATLAAQRALHAVALGQTGELRVRMALHTGAAEEREGDYFGPPLNRVARLLSTGYGGQILLSLATEELVCDQLPEGAVLQNLGEHRLKDLVRPEQVFQLIAADLPSSFPSLKSLDTLPNNLPLQLTSFVGREREMGEVKRLLNTARLVTLLGPGGTGKTRLSLQVAAELLGTFVDGAWLVELAPLSDPLLVPQAVAMVLGVREEPGHPLLSTLTAYLRDKQALLVLDNCEHLVAASAQLVEALLRGCPRLRLLASSREALDFGGETVFRVPPLSLPDARHLPPLEALTQYEAVQLFIDRAVAVVPAFAVTNQNAQALAQVCHRLDGIPLAIELAAARVKVLSAEQIAARLDDRFRLLTNGSRTAQRRQQTLRAAIDWSHDLLSEPERALLRRLSVFAGGWTAVFAGGWTLEAAEAVGAGEGIAAYEVLDLLAQLIDKSLVLVGEGEESRYRLLETVRQYAQEKLVESGEAEVVRGRHLEFFLKLVEQVEPKIEGPDQKVWLERLETELDDLRAALAWCKSGQVSAETGLRLGGALGNFWWTRGYLYEGRAHLKAVLSGEAAAARTTARATALSWAGRLAMSQGDAGAAQALYEESLAIWREVGDKPGIAESLNGLGFVARSQGDFAAAQVLYEESLAIQQEVGDKQGTAESLGSLGHMAFVQGDYAAARARYEESLAIRREVGDKSGIAWSLRNLGDWVGSQGDYAAARALLEESLAIFREVGSKRGIAWSLGSLGDLVESQGDYAAARALQEESLAIWRELGNKGGIAEALHDLGDLIESQGDYAAAWALQEESLAIWRELGNKPGIAWSLIGLGHVLWRQGDAAQTLTLYREAVVLFRQMGDKRGIAMTLEYLAELAETQKQPARAARLFGAAAVLREAIGVPIWPAIRTEYERNVADMRAQLDDEVFVAAWAEGRAMTMEQVIEYALREER